MVIKDLLSKVSSPEEKNDPKVAALREKLASLKQPETPSQAPQEPQPKLDKDVQSLATAEEQVAFAKQEDPLLILKEERTQKLIANQVSELIEVNTELQKRLKTLKQEKQKVKQELEKTQQKNQDIQEKMKLIDQRLEKFMGLYEIITNQYNPFHEAKEELPAQAPVGKVKLEDNLTGHAEEVEFAQGNMSSENAQKMQQLLAELEAAEKDKQTTPKEQEALQTQTTTELHEMLAGFESRLTTYIDESLQEKLHNTFTRLEEVLNQEIQEAVRGEVDKLKADEDILSSALQEIESLTSDDDAFGEVQQEIVAEVKHTEDLIKSIPPNLYFHLADGTILKSKQDLIDALRTMPEETFSAHVTSAYNHFADWMVQALEDASGDALRGKSRDEMIAVLEAP